VDWLSCEEVSRGYVFECDPRGPASAAVRRSALGRFKHEAAAADPVRKVIYQTEDVFGRLLLPLRPELVG
jgi:secreted PhoX family phosphatase